MFNAYTYFKENPVGGLVVYKVTGISKLEELISDIRETQFPCLVVDYGADGMLNIESGCSDRSYHSIHLIDSAGESVTDTDKIFSIMDQMFILGKRAMKQMKSDSSDPAMPCYGFNPRSIQYSRIGPVGMQGYGYSFNFEMIRDHET